MEQSLSSGGVPTNLVNIDFINEMVKLGRIVQEKLQKPEEPGKDSRHMTALQRLAIRRTHSHLEGQSWHSSLSSNAFPAGTPSLEPIITIDFIPGLHLPLKASCSICKS